MKTTHRHRIAGFTLVEVVLALGVAGFCLTTIFGLLPVGLTSNQNAANQTAAVNVATTVLSDLYATPDTSASSPRFQFSLSGSNTQTGQTVYFAGDGTTSGLAGQTAASAGGSAPWLYRATVWVTPPAANTRNATMARVLITWPALAANFTGSYETVVALNRN
ncbi:MAG TPA: hypothetical protein VHY22_00370 [Chthoniobacteraceae bacterium]|jgi:uncharacterized protein (TIGR02598 family)|nr:hypothetical protein [Chthoniobacteraceae bacterium]